MSATRELYRSFCSGRTDIPLFHRPEWLDICCGKNAWDACIVLDNGHIDGILPYQKTRNWGLTVIRQPSLCPYLGPIVFTPITIKNDKSKEQFYTKTIQQLLESLPKSRFTRILSTSQLTDPLPFIWSGFQADYSCTYVIRKTSDKQKLWEQLDKSTKRKITSAQSHGLSVRIDQDIEQFYHRHCHTYKNKGLKINYSLEQLAEIYSYLSENQSGFIYSAYDSSGLWHASIFIVQDTDQCYYLLSGRDMSKKQNAMFLLWWHSIIQHCKTRDYNFEGSLHQNISRVYRSYGADRIDLYNFSKKSIL